MSQRKQIYLLIGLLVVLAASVYYYLNRSEAGGVQGVFAEDTKFTPLDVEEPELRLDLLRKLQKLEYSGSHRNIFVAAPPPPPAPPPSEKHPANVGPQQPPPPPPPQVPGEFFGYASQPRTGKRVAFFTSGDDVLVVAEGATFLSRFRLDRIGNDSADVEEISSGRHVTMPMVQPPDQGAGAN